MVVGFFNNVRVTREGFRTLPAGDESEYEDGTAAVVLENSHPQGISDAFLDAEGLAAALDAALTGRRVPEEALADWHRARDERVRPMYELTFELATVEPPPPELEALLAASAGNQRAMDAFARMFTGVVPVPEFFAPGTSRASSGTPPDGCAALPFGRSAPTTGTTHTTGTTTRPRARRRGRRRARRSTRSPSSRSTRSSSGPWSTTATTA